MGSPKPGGGKGGHLQVGELPGERPRPRTLARTLAGAEAGVSGAAGKGARRFGPDSELGAHGEPWCPLRPVLTPEDKQVPGQADSRALDPGWARGRPRWPSPGMTAWRRPLPRRTQREKWLLTFALSCCPGTCNRPRAPATPADVRGLLMSRQQVLPEEAAGSRRFVTSGGAGRRCPVPAGPTSPEHPRLQKGLSAGGWVCRYL